MTSWALTHLQRHPKESYTFLSQLKPMGIMLLRTGLLSSKRTRRGGLLFNCSKSHTIIKAEKKRAVLLVSSNITSILQWNRCHLHKHVPCSTQQQRQKNPPGNNTLLFERWGNILAWENYIKEKVSRGKTLLQETTAHVLLNSASLHHLKKSRLLYWWPPASFWYFSFHNLFAFSKLSPFFFSHQNNSLCFPFSPF